MLQQEVMETLSPIVLQNLHLICKWGLDGSSSQSMYKQASKDSFPDSDLIMTCVVPLQLYYKGDNCAKVVVWQNVRPSSTRYCRPLKLEFKKENKETILTEQQSVQKQIDRLEPSNVTMPRCGSIQVRHRMIMSMIDGKVCNAITHTSSQRCCVCGALPREMNDIDKVLERRVDTEAFQFGLSTLHAYIRFLGWLLHVSYRLETLAWKKSKDTKDLIEKRKTEIQKKFKSEMGILVDIVKQGSGSSNDGNTARRFFLSASKSAAITELDEELISRCDTVLRTLSCGYAVNVLAFQEYAIDTARHYARLYPWFPMPASVHRILIHGSDVIAVALLPIGMLSEEAMEARNKDFRRFREKRCRKTSREDTNKDLFNILMISSDPLISSLRPLPPRKDGSLKPAVCALLQNVATPESESEDSDE
jgi:hypothetical protein